MKLTESYLRNLIKQAINEMNSEDVPGEYGGEAARSGGTYAKTSIGARVQIADIIEAYPELLSDYKELIHKGISDEKILSLLSNEIADPERNTTILAAAARNNAADLASKNRNR